MNVSLPKLKAAVLFFAENTNPHYLGKVKLMKLLYFLDFQHVRQHGLPVIGDEYFKLEMGPIPTVSKNLVDTLLTDPENSGLADTIAIKTYDGLAKQEIVPVRTFGEADRDLFTPTEFETLERVARRFKDTSTRDMIELSHSEAPFYKTEYLDKIPYELAGYDEDSKFTVEELKFLNRL
jgi:uncharacterized phage-associated protein